MTVENGAAPAAAELVAAIQAGDIDSVRRLVAGTPELGTGPLGGPFKIRTALARGATGPATSPMGLRWLGS